MSIRTTIVDDEPLARSILRTLIGQVSDFTVLAECSNGREAVEAIRREQPDLVFLDVQMPGMTGFDVLEAIALDQMKAHDVPIIVFVTAYDQHALRAFDYHALDYLLKPVDEERFFEALERIRQRMTERSTGIVQRQLSALLQFTSRGSASPGHSISSDRIAVSAGQTVRLLRTEEIDFIDAAGDYVQIHSGERTFLLRETMRGMDERLDPQRFMRIHRSTIVNVDRIRSLRPHANGEYVVVLEDGCELKLSRGYREQLKKRFGRHL